MGNIQGLLDCQLGVLKGLKSNPRSIKSRTCLIHSSVGKRASSFSVVRCSRTSVERCRFVFPT